MEHRLSPVALHRPPDQRDAPRQITALRLDQAEKVQGVGLSGQPAQHLVIERCRFRQPTVLVQPDGTGQQGRDIGGVRVAVSWIHMPTGSP